ncbi:hypothetical protein NE237_016773 [Protea cynaroides]|uniref:Uncharacterized protein n=1 Tax=Protea cynaroides TaxID=273540 RepID=A0A9Q0K5T5_9MAGN|nr:hypothetical protein NE237_016773 [Protea cynaroides]
MPNRGYYEVKFDADVLELVKIFKEQGRAMLLEVYGVNRKTRKRQEGSSEEQGAAEEGGSTTQVSSKLTPMQLPLLICLGALLNEPGAGWVIRDLFSTQRDQAWVITEWDAAVGAGSMLG